jgi:hypothetical protein
MFDFLKDYALSIEPCGSKVTCNPPPQDTDTDYLVVINDDEELVSRAVSALSGEGYAWEGSQKHYQDEAGNNFMSWRKADVNLIVTASHAFAAKHRIATSICKRLNLMQKKDRIMVFQAVLYGNTNYEA